jgi:hypothetical protein
VFTPDRAPGRRVNIENVRLITAGTREQRVIDYALKLHSLPSLFQKLVRKASPAIRHGRSEWQLSVDETCCGYGSQAFRGVASGETLRISRTG